MTLIECLYWIVFAAYVNSAALQVTSNTVQVGTDDE